MKLLKLPPQIVRLVILIIAIVSSYAVARHIMTPASFGKYGHYRGDALTEMAAREPVFGGSKSCDECHSDVRVKFAKFEHKSISCETCHGPARAHGNDPDHVDMEKPPATLCLRCHEFNAGRPAWLKQIEVSKHYSGQGKCTECHIPHQPSEVP
jgi:hypothetical protein